MKSNSKPKSTGKTQRKPARKSEAELRQEYWETQARARAAWGLFGAVVRQQNLNRQLSRCKTRDEREALISEARNQNGRGFYIG